MNFKSFLAERYVNLLSKDDKRQYVDTVWDLLQLAYKDIGGFKSAVSKDHLIDDSGLWKLVKKDNKIVGVSIYKDAHGRKTIAVASDQTPEGKKAVITVNAEDLRMNRAWCEVSGKVETMFTKLGAKMIPSKYAHVLTKKEILEYDEDGFHYTRLLAGEPKKKVIVGFPKMSDADLKHLEKEHPDLDFKNFT